MSKLDSLNAYCIGLIWLSVMLIGYSWCKEVFDVGLFHLRAEAFEDEAPSKMKSCREQVCRFDSPFNFYLLDWQAWLLGISSVHRGVGIRNANDRIRLRCLLQCGRGRHMCFPHSDCHSCRPRFCTISATRLAWFGQETLKTTSSFSAVKLNSPGISGPVGNEIVAVERACHLPQLLQRAEPF